MLWLMTMGRRLNGVYAAFMLVAFMMGIAGVLQAPTSACSSAAKWAHSLSGSACFIPLTRSPVFW